MDIFIYWKRILNIYSCQIPNYEILRKTENIKFLSMKLIKFICDEMPFILFEMNVVSFEMIEAFRKKPVLFFCSFSLIPSMF